MRQSPLVLHVIHRFGAGGLENGLVNLINGTPEYRYEHAVVCLEEATPFAKRIRRPIPVVALHKRPGKDLRIYRDIWTVFRRLQPAIVHTRNLPTIELPLVAAAAGVKGRVHSEHGHDVGDPSGTNRKYRLVRRAVRPCVHRYVTVSQNLRTWLGQSVGVPESRVRYIPNGVDAEAFHPVTRRDSLGARRVGLKPDSQFADDNCFVVGTVGRLAEVKNQTLLIAAVAHLLDAQPALRQRLRLVIAGDGPLMPSCREVAAARGIDAITWFPGELSDIPSLLRGLDLFVLPSLTEGMSNTILEAMATGLPVLATRVGGNPELVEDDVTGMLVPSGDPERMAAAIARYASEPGLTDRHGRAGRLKVETSFSLNAMIAGYMSIYDDVLGLAPSVVASGRGTSAVGAHTDAGSR
jgi:sugar transferase (PEP-CTERM/EpsH1 system associated)